MNEYARAIHQNQTDMLIGIAMRGGNVDDREAQAHIEYGYDGRVSRTSPAKSGAIVRSLRLEQAKLKGTHTKAEWTALADIFGACVSCGRQYHELLGGAPTKDHIIPLHLGGCDCIANIQPMCRECNSGKPNNDDLRSRACPDWAKQFIAHLQSGME